jgi:hypothetical protein
VHSVDAQRGDPIPEPLYDDASATDRFRASGRQHSGQDRRADSSVGLPGGNPAGSRPSADRCLVATHRRFDLRALAVAGGNLPDQSSAFGDYRQMAVTLYRRTRNVSTTLRHPGSEFKLC